MQRLKYSRQAHSLESETLQGTYVLLSKLFALLSTPDKVLVLHKLSNPGPQGFSTIQLETRKNPKIVSSNLKELQSYGLVRQRRDRRYEITDEGRLALDASPKDIIDIIRLAVRVARQSGKAESQRRRQKTI